MVCLKMKKILNFMLAAILICGNITIKSSVTQVDATPGSGAEPIGRGDHSTCGTVTIEDS